MCLGAADDLQSRYHITITSLDSHIDTDLAAIVNLLQY
jgi:hypothetical protein